MQLSELQTGQKGVIVKVLGRGAFRKRIIEMGFVRGKEVEVIRNAPLRDPIHYRVMGYDVSLRRTEAALIRVVSAADYVREFGVPDAAVTSGEAVMPSTEELSALAMREGKTVHVALVGNPNCGKTSLFNFASGLHEHVGNYSGVTVDAKDGVYRHKGYTFRLVDLPGTYSLSGYTPEESYVCRHLEEERPDVVVNVLDATNLERNLYLTTQLIDLDVPTVIALNMYDELQNKGDRFDYPSLERMLGIPIVPTVGKTGAGIEELFERIIRVYEGDDPVVRHIRINYGDATDSDSEAEARYSFIYGALLETYHPNTQPPADLTRHIDRIVTHRYFGFPIFFLFLWLMFEATFRLGNYPMEWITIAVEATSHLLHNLLPAGPLKDLLIDGIVGGVGGVIIFLPNILILYLFISFMEDSGYMARAAFIMDKVMHRIGLHGKSFIPLVMGFGCNVPAILSSRTIESHNSRLVTMLINPLMSCSARLPVYVLLTTAFFTHTAPIILLSLYATGILLAALLARLFRRLLFRGQDVPFVMELPPYRLPTWRSVSRHVWHKARQYLNKMGGIILLASIIIWYLGYYPRSKDPAAQQEQSYIARVGHAIQPVMQPLGFDWQTTVALLTGMAAKEVVVSTFAVLYPDDPTDPQPLSTRLTHSHHTPLSALSLMLFVLIYFPCIATVTAISREAGSWRWGALTVAYTTLLAWLLCFLLNLACGGW